MAGRGHGDLFATVQVQTPKKLSKEQRRLLEDLAKMLPKEKFEGYKKPERTLPRNGRGDLGMKQEWARAIKENKPEIAYSNFDFAAMLTETILLGNVAMRAGKKLEWDGPNLKFTTAPEADKLLRMEYRGGWVL